MTSSTKTPRLLEAAKEFNIGKETLVAFLAEKGFEINGNQNSKLTEKMYIALQEKFAQSKLAKRKSDELDLPKGSYLDNHRKNKEDNDTHPKEKKDDQIVQTHPSTTPSATVGSKTPVQPHIVTPPPVAVPLVQVPSISPTEKEDTKDSIQAIAGITDTPADHRKQTVDNSFVENKNDENNAASIQKNDTNIKIAEQAIHAVEESFDNKPEVKTEQKSTASDNDENQKKSVEGIINVETPSSIAEPENEEIKVPKIGLPNVLGKINLDEMNLASRPKKGYVKKTEDKKDNSKKVESPIESSSNAPVIAQPELFNKEETTRVEPTPIEPPPSVPEFEKESNVAVEVAPSKEDDAAKPEHIEMKAPKLEGPKIIGKIELPVAQPQGGFKPDNKEKRKRKRIPVDKKPEGGKPDQQLQGNKDRNFKDQGNREQFRDNRNRPQGENRTGSPEFRPNTDNRNTTDNRPNRDNRGGLEFDRNKDRNQVGPNRQQAPRPNQGFSANTGGGGYQQNQPQTDRNRGSGDASRTGFRPQPQGGQPQQGGQQRFDGGNNQGRFDNKKPAGRDYRTDNRNQRPPETQGPQQEIDTKAIQDKIRETQAKLTGSTRGKNLKAKYRRNKRDEMAERRMAAENAESNSAIQVTEFISVSELANLLNVSFADVISKCMGLGIMVSINQRLDAEVIELVSSEFGYEVEFINLEQTEEVEEEILDNEEDLIPRPPIVTIMGHVDHGKTSLLDYIRSANVVAGEAGGITQHIGAYQVTTSAGKKVTFLDTPGHEAFTAMRARGAKVADLAVIVIAADDAIMPQTKEAISHAQAANLPMIFAINKIDKQGANPEKIKEQLANLNILVEDWGGKYQSQEISAKQGLGVDVLLEKIGLEAELLEVKANPDRTATGSVIEASLDKGRGYQSTILVQNGTLNQGEMIVCGQYFGKIKAMFNERGQRVKTAGPSSPVQVLGLNGAPQAGEKFKVYDSEVEAKEVATHRSQIMREQGIRTRKHITLDEIGRRLALGNFKELSVIIKGDFDGSVEAISDSLQKLSTQEVSVNIVHKAVGQITESDVLLATASDAIIIGFQVRPSMQAAKLAQQENIEIRNYSIIYDAIDEIKSAMEGLLEPKIEKRTVSNIEIREIYKISGIGTIAGCYVLEGKMTRQTKLNLVRDGIVVYNGELGSLKRFKDDVKDVNAGYECGLTIKNYSDMRVGDIIEGYEEVEVKRTL